jgi:ferredoxin-type protein NapG
MLLPTVHSDYCTGCGKCEKSCVLPGESAIKVLPIRLAQGSRAEHYRRGWEEKQAAGQSLIGEQTELPVRGLEGRAYGDVRVGPGEGPVAAEPAAPGSAAGGLDSGWKP